MRPQSRAKIFLLLAAGLAWGCGDDDSDDGDVPLTDSGSPIGEDDGGPAPIVGQDAGRPDIDASMIMDAAISLDAGDAGRDGSTTDAATDAATSDAAIVLDGGRVQDTRKFTIDEASLAFPALADAPESDRFTGVLDGAGYRIEVPKQWNGMLVMYAHGYAGEQPALRVTTPSIRRHLLENGYAWAASSYSTNYYDVRAGVEDTNKLALAFTRIAAAKGRTLTEPTKRYIVGHSMGGHITGAAIEKEALETAASKVRYDGAVPMCGVLGDTELFDYFAAYQLATQQLAKVQTTATGASYEPVRAQMKPLFFSTFPKQATATTPAVIGATTALGNQLSDIVENLTGGERPFFEQGFLGPFQDTVWGTFGGDGTINGVLTKPVTNTRNIEYQFDDDPALSAEERAFNDSVARVTSAPDANPLRTDGVRWIPKVNGEFSIPVVSLHTLGDLYVPFKMEQIYRQRAEAKGSSQWLVQRAIRGISHCDFTVAEQVAAFDAMTTWEQDGVKPEGDDVLTRSVVGAPDYGCRFTNNTTTADDNPATGAVRATLPGCQTAVQ